MNARNTEQPGPGHGMRLFRGLDQHAGLLVRPGPLVTDASAYGAKAAQLLIVAQPNSPLQPERLRRIFARSTYITTAIHDLAESMREPSTLSGH
jgi:hypothetical protein